MGTAGWQHIVGEGRKAPVVLRESQRLDTLSLPFRMMMGRIHWAGAHNPTPPHPKLPSSSYVAI